MSNEVEFRRVGSSVRRGVVETLGDVIAGISVIDVRADDGVSSEEQRGTEDIFEFDRDNLGTKY